MNKILPVRFPFISSYPYYANPLTILAATGNEYIPWMLNNFIQLSCHPENKILKVDFFRNGLLGRHIAVLTLMCNLLAKKYMKQIVI